MRGGITGENGPLQCVSLSSEREKKHKKKTKLKQSFLFVCGGL